MSLPPFPDRPRVDARDKVLGRIAYAADVAVPGLLHAMTVPSRVAKGTITALPTEAAMRVPGVVRVLTPADFAPPQPPSRPGEPPSAPPALVNEIAYRGQPVALVVAETLEAAIEGAEAIHPEYDTAPFAALLDSPGAERQAVPDTTAGDPAAMMGAVTVVEARYESRTQHHNPMEMLSTTALWSGGRLTILEGTQNSGGLRAAVAGALRLDLDDIEVRSPTVGGAFGQKGQPQRQTVIIARAAMLLGRPVKLVVPRAQIFHNASFRPHSRHHVRLGADVSGRIVAVRTEAEHAQSRAGSFPPNYHEAALRLYGIPNYHGTAANVRLDTNAPGFMRAPHEHPAIFAFESAVDEMAYRLGRDPLELRLAHDVRTDPENGKPLSSRFLNECLTRGAERFGWSRRTRAPGSMTAPDGTLVGWGVSGGCYPSKTTAALARLRITADGRTRFAISGHEMGQGIRTVIAAVLTEGLDLDPDKLEIVIGDPSEAPQHNTSGSWGSNSVAPAAAEAVVRMRAAVAELLAGRHVEGNLHRQIAAVRRPFVQVEVGQLAPGQEARVLGNVERGGYALAGPVYPDFTTMSYSAHFVEVRIEPRTRRVRVPRVVSFADCGRVISPRTAASQVRGGIVWAIGATLREETETDPRFGGYLNDDLADYVVPVNADIGEIEVGFVDEPDPLANSVGLKGLGEVAMVGAAAAIGNAIFHATGKRFRELPIRIEHLLED